MATPRIHEGVVVQGRPEDVKQRLLAVAGTDGYQLLGETPQGFGLRRKRIPLWAILGAVFFFPFGLLLLLARVEEVVTVAVERVAAGTHVTTVGRASVALQRALQQQLGAFRVAGAPAPRWVAGGVPPPPPSPAAPPPPAAPQDTPPSALPVPGELPPTPVPVTDSVRLPTAAMTGSPGGLASYIGPPGGAGATYRAGGPVVRHSAPLPQPLGPIGGPPPPPLGGLPGGGFPGGGPPGGLGPLDLPEIPKVEPPRPPSG